MEIPVRSITWWNRMEAESRCLIMMATIVWMCFFPMDHILIVRLKKQAKCIGCFDPQGSSRKNCNLKTSLRRQV